MDTHLDIMAVRLVVADRDEPLPVDPPGEGEVVFASGYGRWLLSRVEH
jgi:hypothetical protein